MPIAIIDVSSATVLGDSAFARYIRCGGASPYAVTLPDAGSQSGRTLGIMISQDMTNLVSLTGASGQLIDGENIRIMWAGETALLMSDGVGWTKLHGKSIPMQCAMRLNAPFSVTGGAAAAVIPWNQVDIDNTGLMADPVTNHGINIVRKGTYQLSLSVLATSLAANAEVLTQTKFSGVALFADQEHGVSGQNVATANSQPVLVLTLGRFICEITSSANCDAFGDPNGNSSYYSAIEVPSW